MDVPKIKTREQMLMLVDAIETISTFDGWTTKWRSYAFYISFGHNIDIANQNVDDLWRRLTKRQKEKILKEYVILHLER